MGCDPHASGEWQITKVISIHAARVGCDRQCKDRYCVRFISIHAARVGCDVDLESDTSSLAIFQSTQPEWAATR